MYLVNSVSGNVVYKFVERNVDLSFPLCVYYSGHNLIVTFTRVLPHGTTQQEISVTELYRSQFEDDTVKLIKDAFVGAERITSHTFSSFSEENPISVQETYVFPLVIKGLTLTQTANHITSKALIVITNNNHLYNIESNLYSARRPHTNMPQAAPKLTLDDAEEGEEEPSKELQLKTAELPPYDALLPLKETKYVSHGLKLNGLDKIISFNTNLESTSQILAFGHDIFCARISPENTFDRLTD